MAAITPQNGRVAFLVDQTPHTYFELNSTNLGTNYGDDPAGGDNTAVASGDISTQESYDGMNNANAPPTGTAFDNYLINDAGLLLYIPADMTHGTVRGIFHNGGGTNGQGLMIRATTTGVEIAVSHNNGNATSQDCLIEEIPDADLPGWFCIGAQYNSHGGTEGDMALWLNGTAVRSATRTFTLDWGSGNPEMGDANHAEPNQAQVRDPGSYTGGDWGADNTIDGTGILIANFTCDNPSDGASDTSAGNGNAFHTDYYDAHVAAGESITVPVGALALTGNAPARAEVYVGVPVGSADITGQTPARGVGLQLLGNAPLAVESGGGGDITEEPLVGSLSLTGAAPSAEVTHIREAPVGGLTLTGAAPSAEISHNRETSVGGLTLTGVIPVASATENHVIAVPTGSLTVTGAAPSAEIVHSKTPTVVALTLTGAIPLADTGANQVRAPPVVALDLAAAAPTLDVSDHLTTQPSVGSLSLTGIAPSAEITHNRSIPVGSLALTGQDPVAGAGDNKILQPLVGDLSLSGQAPSAEIEHNRSVPVGSLSLTGIAPTVNIGAPGAITVTPSVGALTLFGTATNWGLRLYGQVPTIDLTDSGAVSPPVGSLTLTGTAPSAEITHNKTTPVGVLALTGAAPSSSIQHIAAPSAGTFSLTGAAPSAEISPVSGTPAGALTLTGLAPSAEITHSKTIPVGSLSLTGGAPKASSGLVIPTGSTALAGQAPSIDRFISPPAGVIEFSGLFVNVPGVNLSANPGTGSLALSGAAPRRGRGLLCEGQAPTAVISGGPLSPGEGAIALTGYAPDVSKLLNPSTVTISFGSDAPFVSIPGGPGTVQPLAGSVSLTGTDAEFTNTGDMRLILAGQAPFASIGIVTDVIAEPSGANLPITGKVPNPVVNPTGSVVAAPNTVDLTLSGSAPEAVIPLITEPLAGSLVLTGKTPNPVSGAVPISVVPNTVDLTLSGQIPQSVIPGIPAPPTGTLSLAEKTPNPVVSQDQSTVRVPNTQEMSVIGRVPLTIRADSPDLSAGALTLTGQAPTASLVTFDQTWSIAFEVTISNDPIDGAVVLRNHVAKGVYFNEDLHVSVNLDNYAGFTVRIP